MGAERHRWLITIGVMIAAFAGFLATFQAYQVKLLLPGMCGGLDTRMTDLQHHEAAAIEEFRQDVSATRRNADDAIKQVAELKERIARYEGAMDEQKKFRLQTTTRLDRIERNTAQTNRTVEHVDQKVEQAIPPLPPAPAKPWWRAFSP